MLPTKTISAIMTANNDANINKHWPMTDMHCPNYTDTMMDIETDQCLVEEKKQMSIKSIGSTGIESLQWFKCTGSLCKMIADAQLKGHQSLIASDDYIPSMDKTVKKYASLPTHRDLAHILYDCFKNDKPCTLYEIIEQGKETLFYGDFEWIEKEYSGDQRLTILIEALE
jgi:hypothetical protein